MRCKSKFYVCTTNSTRRSEKLPRTITSRSVTRSQRKFSTSKDDPSPPKVSSLPMHFHAKRDASSTAIQFASGTNDSLD